jgi:hypothetical protein
LHIKGDINKKKKKKSFSQSLKGIALDAKSETSNKSIQQELYAGIASSHVIYIVTAAIQKQQARNYV